MGVVKGGMGDRTRAGITGASEVLGEYDNGRRGMEFGAERGSVWVTYFKYRSLHKYTRVQGVEKVWRLRA